MTTLAFKVFSPSGEYLAACKRPEEAAMLVGALGIGSEIRTGHRKKDRVWHEGYEAQRAQESYDFVGATVRRRRVAAVATMHAEYDRAAAAARQVVKHESTSQRGVFFWAERVYGPKPTVESWSVVAQAPGGPASEAFDDWLTNFTDADDIAQRLARGEEL